MKDHDGCCRGEQCICKQLCKTHWWIIQHYLDNKERCCNDATKGGDSAMQAGKYIYLKHATNMGDIMYCYTESQGIDQTQWIHHERGYKNCHRKTDSRQIWSHKWQRREKDHTMHETGIGSITDSMSKQCTFLFFHQHLTYYLGNVNTVQQAGNISCQRISQDAHLDHITLSFVSIGGTATNLSGKQSYLSCLGMVWTSKPKKMMMTFPLQCWT